MSEEIMEKDDAPAMKKKAIGISKDSALTVLAESNPKRPGSASYSRFEGYFTDPAPTTVQEALANGLTMGDIAYDFIHGSISVEGAEVVEYQPRKRASKSDEDSESSDEAVEAEETEDEEVF